MSNDTPLKLLDGSVVYTDGRVIDAEEQVELKKIEIKDGSREHLTKTSLAEIPVKLESFNALTAVVIYDLIGLQEEDIAFLLHIDIAQIRAVVKSAEYLKARDFLVEKIFEIEKEDARAILAQNSTYAARKIVRTMAEKGALGYMAAKDVLALQKIDQRPQDASLRTLEIVVMKKEELDQRSVDGIKITLGG